MCWLRVSVSVEVNLGQTKAGFSEALFGTPPLAAGGLCSDAGIPAQPFCFTPVSAFPVRLHGRARVLCMLLYSLFSEEVTNGEQSLFCIVL